MAVQQRLTFYQMLPIKCKNENKNPAKLICAALIHTWFRTNIMPGAIARRGMRSSDGPTHPKGCRSKCSETNRRMATL